MNATVLSNAREELRMVALILSEQIELIGKLIDLLPEIDTFEELIQAEKELGTSDYGHTDVRAMRQLYSDLEEARNERSM